mmetsp:Transcript_3146/g.7867  ORF Transcript_3146/g.7867 Transcript_3146/m.7867 type:complete len:512 (-) Transcript_3146:94-1629(-)|eukprot:jgi/Tetstr1/442805/TSEL_030889.t1
MDDFLEGEDLGPEGPGSRGFTPQERPGGGDPGGGGGGGMGLGDTGLPRVTFSCVKGESHTPKSGFKNLFRRLRSMFKPDKLENREDLRPEGLAGSAILVLGCPRERFSVTEFEALKGFIMGGGSVLVFAGEGGEDAAGTNINYLLEEFGISVNSDCVVRTVHYKYLHPKEVHISDGVLNREVLAQVGKHRKGGPEPDDDATLGGGGRGRGGKDFDGTGLEFVYPYGATLTVQKPAIPLLATGKIAYPMHRPLAAVWAKRGAGKLVVMGSAQVFDDKWLDKEENSKLMDFVFKFLKPNSPVVLNPIDADDPDIIDMQPLPDTEALAERLRACLQEGEEPPRDWAALFDDGLFKLHTDAVPEAVGLYSQLHVNKAPLTLISPQFETPLPPLHPAIFPPAMREPPPPALELFDLDDCFASEHVRLAQLANKCADGGENDMEYFVHEAASIVGLPQADDASVSATALLAELFKEVVEYKKQSSVAALAAGGYDAGGYGFGSMAGDESTGINLVGM